MAEPTTKRSVLSRHCCVISIENAQRLRDEIIDVEKRKMKNRFELEETYKKRFRKMSKIDRSTNGQQMMHEQILMTQLILIREKFQFNHLSLRISIDTSINDFDDCSPSETGSVLDDEANSITKSMNERKLQSNRSEFFHCFGCRLSSANS